MSALYNALLEGETKEKLALMVCELREENALLRGMLGVIADGKFGDDACAIENFARNALPKETP